MRKPIFIFSTLFILFLLFRKMNTGASDITGNSATLEPWQINTIQSLVNTLVNSGITNKYTIAAILSICAKEGQFLPVREKGYANTSNPRIRSIFGDRVAGLSDSQLSYLKSNDVNFFNYVYGSIGGYKYRGGGYNQITGRSNYKKRGENIGIDLENNPHYIETPSVAARALVDYMKSTIGNASNDIKKHYNFSDINSFTSLKDAVGAIYHANAGLGKSYATILADSTGGRKKAFYYAPAIYNLLT